MPYIMYVTLQGDDKMLKFTMNPDSGQLTPQGEMVVPGGPALLAIDPAQRFLYVGRRGDCEVSSYRIAPQTGDLTLLGTVGLETDPCYMATDRSGRFLLSAYYEGQTAAVHPIGDDGVAYGPPIEWRHTARGAHAFQTDPSNRYAFVPHIAGRGPNEIWQFKFDAETGRLTPNTPPKVQPAQPDGPRHFCFHPHRDILYVSNEQGCSVTAYHFDTAAGTLSPLQTVSTLPEDYDGANSCAQIGITPSGKFLHAPNRGHNSMACFSVDADSGQLTPVGRVPTEPVPRAFCIDPTGHFLYSAGLESGRLAAFRIDQHAGTLTPLEVYTVGDRPMWVSIINV